MFRYRKEERCLPLVLKVTSQNELRKSKSICPVNKNQRKRSSTDNPATYKRKKCAINITDNQAISSDHPLKRSPTRKDLVLYQRNFDIPLSFENQDVFSGLACAYEQSNKLLFIGGGYDITKKEFSRIAQGKRTLLSSNELFKAIFSHVLIFLISLNISFFNKKYSNMMGELSTLHLTISVTYQQLPMLVALLHSTYQWKKRLFTYLGDKKIG